MRLEKSLSLLSRGYTILSLIFIVGGFLSFILERISIIGLFLMVIVGLLFFIINGIFTVAFEMYRLQQMLNKQEEIVQ